MGGTGVHISYAVCLSNFSFKYKNKMKTAIYRCERKTFKRFITTP